MEQLRTYLEEEAQRHGKNTDAFLEKAVGVALDGEQILFVRYSRKPQILATPVPIETDQRDFVPEVRPQQGVQVQGPFPVSAQSLASLLIYVRSAARRPLTAENLAGVFGPDNEVARIAVAELYSAVMRGQRRSSYSRLNTFYQEWDRIFGAVYGEKLEKAESAVDETARLYQLPSGARLKPLLFGIHTYYALLMKLIAHELLAMQKRFSVTSFVQGAGTMEDEELKEKLGYLESGSDFNALGIVNFLEADFFSWYLDVWNKGLGSSIRGLVRALAEFEPATPVLEPDWTRDLLQKLYELIVPRVLRHSLGEYYTPDWLAGHLLDKSGYTGDSATRFLDPACGSGTFLVQAIQRAAQFAAGQPRARMAETARAILHGVVGFDLNPLAVLAARTNYLIAFARFLPYVRPVSIPVYLCDSVVPPDRYLERQASMFDENGVVFHTQEHNYVFPLSMKDKERIEGFCSLVLESLRGKLAPPAFRKRLEKNLPLPADEHDRLEDVYHHIKRLQDENRDGIWAHYIKNAFAPVYVGRFDYVVGNPPWIRWGFLSGEYRARTLRLWHDYGLFSLKGHETRLGAGEKDFSMLFTYACADRYLKDGGTLAFVITEEVFKSKGAGEGFRRFQLGEEGARLKALWMEDLVHLQPFQAANKTTTFAMKKGEPTSYPVPVAEWRRKSGVGKIPAEWALEEVLAKTERRNLQAVPVDSAKLVSSWQTASRSELKGFESLKGKNHYKAHLGARVEPYGVFWLKLVNVRPDGMLVVENQHDRGKREIKPMRAALEQQLIYPAVAGGELQRYGVSGYFYVLMAQNPVSRKGHDEDWMASDLPLTYAYLVQFKDTLIERAAYQKYFFREIKKDGKVVRREPTGPFYSMYNISELSFKPYRVAWKRMAQSMAAAVLTKVGTPFGRKEVISTDTTSFMVAASRKECHYLCAVLNSDLVNAYISSFSSGGRGFGAPSVMQNLAIPRFTESNRLHQALTELSEEAHQRVERGKTLDDIDGQVNQAIRELWTIKP
ncbi:MAG: Eco57I restriction-modification methylase domain-containing protein [Chromatiales bacterium]